LFFAQHNITVVAVDIAVAAIEELVAANPSGNPRFLVQDFSRLPTPIDQSLPTTFDHVYSRFTLHAVPRDSSSRALKWSFDNLKHGGLLLIEVRSVKDKMFGVGTPVPEDADAFISSHYRRFVRLEQLKSELETLGFVVDYVIEKDGLSVYKDDNPVLIRVHARKP
jgi:SAM-dependent methyltransferase